MKANWFAAFPIDAGTWYAPLTATCPDTCRPFAPSDLHLTLAFFGHLTEAAVEAVQKHLSQLSIPAMGFQFDHVVLLPQATRFSAMCLGLGRGGATVAAQMETHRDALLATAGLPPENRAALPHVTFARPIRKFKQQAQQDGADWSRALVVPDKEIQVKELALYTWSADRQKTKFRIVARFPLQE
ncbi:2'-5' RNA ligase family protein [Acanthopleuribacter pedis]|uniref:Phosphoesterase HXTX domain-containing protein n=1 Tax=Acanthopleuribacter pedis TaxID=442870 RepID=A0A8J7Q981_9BACT|nr:2'-5' RNA ligase family protein [Acanthopleuribacter pedis]MBO1320052.1 hypothetical protein [Acanthopleuribacter pedis]